MARIISAVLLCALPLAACGAAPEKEVQAAPPPPAACDAAPAQSHIGHTATAESGAVLLRITGARQLRWAPPGGALTMDFRADRLTVGYDRNMAITTIACG